MPRATILAVLLSHLACTNDLPPPVASQSRMEIWSAVSFVTDVDPKEAIVLSVGAQGSWTRTELEGTFSKAESVVLLRDGSPVSASVAFKLNAESETTGFSVELKPTLPLVDGWYVLRLGHPLADQAIASAFGFQRAGDGSVATRFRVGSEPFLRMLSYCPSDQILRVSVSEPSRNSNAITVALAGEAMSRSCPTSSKITAGGSEMYFECGVLSSEPISLSIDAESLSGAKVRELDGPQAAFSKQLALSRSELNNDCLVWFAWGNTMPQASPAQ